ncbi:DMT family transporter [Phreatobacter stygius]|uniref:DMT family transporter n=1 Tax=Phreatobacter stygius TaxID=1940610 RepID=A0A4D7BFH9_9HYPH|nr:DMT family transporter [Phreatobacter stygius]QCI66692.1 DMT family transporter [Phreatobacter stygius]
MSSRKALGLLLGFIGVVIFGATLPMTRIAVGHLDPWFVTFGRAALAGLVAVILLAAGRKTVPPRSEWPGYGLAALMLITGFPAFIALAMLTVPSVHGGIVLGILPLATAIASALITGERPSTGFWLAGVAGAALVLAFTLRQAGGLHLEIGDLFLLAAVAASAIGYTVSAVLTRSRPGWEVVSWMLALSLPVTLPAAWLTSPADLAIVPRQAWWAFIYLALFSQFIGFFFWNAGLAMGGIARVSQVQLLQTFVTLAVAALLIGEKVGPETLGFAAAVALVVLIGSRMRTR